jgi:ABC-type transport system involved in multi-copper enzyme maturation permease subunit
MVFRRKLFWGLYVVALFNFLVFFSGIYLLSQIDLEDLMAGGPRPARLAFFRIGNLQEFVNVLRHQLYLAGTAETYRNFFWLQGYIVMAVLALAGSVLVGNDYQHGTLPFYLSKPLGRWHYLLGKLLAVGLFINMMTTIPALVLYAECGLLEGWSYFGDNWRLLGGILGYGAVLTVTLGLLVIAVASALRKTVPMIMVWIGLLFFCRLFANLLVDVLGYDVHWRLIDLWNNTYVLGSECLGTIAKLENRRRMVLAPQPEPWEAAAVLVAVGAVCLVYLSRRIRAVEVVR